MCFFTVSMLNARAFNYSSRWFFTAHKRWLLSLLAFMNLLLNNLKSIAEDVSKRWVAYRFSYAKRHNEAEGGRWVSLMTFWNSEKLSNFKAHKLSWTVSELSTRILRVTSSCPPIANIHKWTLWKNHTSAGFSSKMKHNKKKTHTHKQEDKGN